MNHIHRIALGALVATLLAAGPARAAEGWARSSSWLRAGPSTAYPTIARVSAGEGLSVHGCLDRWSWCDVSVDGDRGWFPGRRIALLRDGRRVELPASAALLGLTVLGFERNAYWSDHYRDRRFPGHGRDRGWHRREVRPPVETHRDPRDRHRPTVGETRRHERGAHTPRPHVGGMPRPGVMPIPEPSRGK